jgi:hypothetical protein
MWMENTHLKVTENKIYDSAEISAQEEIIQGSLLEKACVSKLKAIEHLRTFLVESIINYV